MSQNLDIICDTLVRKATDPQLKEEDWGTNLQLIDYLERNPDDVGPLILQAIVSSMSSRDAQTIHLSLVLLDMCVKSANAELFNRLLSKNLSKVVNLASYHLKTEKECSDYVADWSKSGVQLATSSGSSTLKNSTTTTTSAPTKTTSVPKKTGNSKYNNSEEKLMKDLQVVEENIKIMNDVISNASSPQEVLNDDYQQIYINLQEMHLRVMKIIESLPEEKILLKLFIVNESLDESISNFEKFVKTGQKPKKKLEDKSVDNLDDLFKDLNKKPLMDETDLFLQDTTPTRYVDPIEQEFSNLSHRKEVKTTAPSAKKNENSLDDLFGELSQRKVPVTTQEKKPINSLFDFDAIDDTKKETSSGGGLFDFDQISAPIKVNPSQKVDDPFDMSTTPSKGSNYDEFQQFLESQSKKKSSTNPFE